jgi:hypothetical protein
MKWALDKVGTGSSGSGSSGSGSSVPWIKWDMGQVGLDQVGLDQVDLDQVGGTPSHGSHAVRAEPKYTHCTHSLKNKIINLNRIGSEHSRQNLNAY